MSFVVIALLVILLSRDLPQLLRQKKKKDLAVYGILFAGALTVAFLQSVNVDIPSPIKALRYFMSDVLNVSLEEFK